MDKPFQRKGSESNTHVGRDFERKDTRSFRETRLTLELRITVPIGINGKKSHSFDLGNKVKTYLSSAKPTDGLKAEMFQALN